MSEGRGSGIAVTLVCLVLVSHWVASDGATYTVGGAGGWTFNLSNWPKGKSFKAGDALVFNYDPTTHNVVAVDRGGYGSCTTPASAKVYKTGMDRISLAKGPNYFICNFAGHCQSGMKIAVNAS
ncbi:hypothetical protein ACSBR2_001198 [Camellia fascicularis]